MKALEEKLKNEVMKAFETEEMDKLKNYRITELVQCPRRSYYFKTTDELNPYNGFMFMGHMFHELLPKFVKNLLEFKDGVYEKELELKKQDYRIVGHADIITDSQVYEFKYSRCKQNEAMPFHWILQANAYAVLAGKPKFSIIVVNPYSFDVKVECHGTDEYGLKVLESRAEEIFKAVQSKKDLPIGPLYSWECSYCPFKSSCELSVVKTRKKKGVNKK